MFLLWKGAGFRMAYTFTGAWRIAPEYGQDLPKTETGIATATPPDANFFNQYDIQSLYRRAYPSVQPGDGEWYEFVMGSITMSASTGRGIFAWRRHTTGGVVSPGPWRVYIQQVTNTSAPWYPAGAYQMGVNRNKSFDEEMYWDWGPYEVVDGSKYANPFSVPLP
jgi:hypothetical protein